MLAACGYSGTRSISGRTACEDLGRFLLPPYLHPRKHLTFRLEPLVRVVLQHLLGKLAGHGLDNVLRLTGLEQVRHDRMAQVVEPKAWQSGGVPQ